MEKMNVIEHVIADRHTVKASKMNGEIIPEEKIVRLLQLADQAPTHGKTEPWRFWVYCGEGLKKFGKQHADLYWEYTSENKRKQAKYDKLVRYATQASHLIITVMQRTEKTKIPEFEEIAAVSAAIEHILLGATAMEIASFWNTGGMAGHEAMKEFLGIENKDRVVGFLYLGYSDKDLSELNRKRRIPLKEKIFWEK